MAPRSLSCPFALKIILSKQFYVCLTKTVTAQIMVKCNIVHGLLVRDQYYIILNYAVIELACVQAHEEGIVGLQGRRCIL